MHSSWNSGGFSEYWEKGFFCEGNRGPAQVSQRCCKVSMLEDIKKPCEHDPEQPGLGGPA